MRYPGAEWVPWQNPGNAYWPSGNQPIAVVLHIMAGYAHTAREWAAAGYDHASWHFTVSRDGSVMQHLELTAGGFQAGIPATNPNPTWPLWRGHGQNVNLYTVGIEHEGFPGEPFTAEQAAASRELCRWLAGQIGIPFDHDHFPAHAEIDLVNRGNDFNLPELREAHYRYLFEEEQPMTTAERVVLACASGDYARMKSVYQALVGAGIVSELDGSVDPAADDLNAAMVRRFRLVEVAATNADAAYQVIK